jgi:hypothetical protein
VLTTRKKGRERGEINERSEGGEKEQNKEG